ncbi:unnamed protein product, partial [Ectocarpus fasciculatus]
WARPLLPRSKKGQTAVFSQEKQQQGGADFEGFCTRAFAGVRTLWRVVSKPDELCQQVNESFC